MSPRKRGKRPTYPKLHLFVVSEVPKAKAIAVSKKYSEHVHSKRELLHSSRYAVRVDKSYLQKVIRLFLETKQVEQVLGLLGRQSRTKDCFFILDAVHESGLFELLYKQQGITLEQLKEVHQKFCEFADKPRSELPEGVTEEAQEALTKLAEFFKMNFLMQNY